MGDGAVAKKRGSTTRWTAGALVCAMAFAAGAAADNMPGRSDEGGAARGVFATVGGTVITVEEFQAGLQSGIRQRYFHGNVPESELPTLRREVAQSLIDRLLLAQEARRRGIKPDPTWVDGQAEQLNARMKSDPRWEGVRDALLADARRQLGDESVIQQLREQTEALPAPDVRAVERYYRDHPDKFTTPERMRVSMVLLKVEPWAPSASWAAAEEEAGRLLAQIRGGGDFAALARLHSADGSAERGGDLGYIHRGMFSEETQDVIDGLAPGELSAPVRLLQGYALFRLDERLPPRLNEFAEVAERARNLLLREQQERAWEELRAKLRSSAAIEINEAMLSASD